MVWLHPVVGGLDSAVGSYLLVVGMLFAWELFVLDPVLCVLCLACDK